MLAPRSPVERSALMLSGAMAAGAALALFYVQREFGAGVMPSVAAAGMAGLWAAVLIGLGRLRPLTMLATAALLSLVLRAVAAVWFQGLAPANDPLSYLTVSQSLLDGQGMIAWGARAYYPPLYPLLLAGARFLIADPVAAVTVLNAVSDGFAAMLVFILGRQWFGDRTGAIAAAAWLLWPSVLIGSAVAQKEGLTVALFLWLVVLVICPIGRTPRYRALFAGLPWGLLALAQPALALLPMFVFAATSESRGSWKATATDCMLAALCAGLVLTPWWIRNYLLFDTFVPLTSAGGSAFARLVPDPILTINEDFWSLSEPERGAQTWRQAVAWIAVHPFDYLINVALRAGRGIVLDIGSAQRLLWFSPAPAAATVALLITLCQLVFMLAWAGATAALLRPRWQHGKRLMLMLLLAGFLHMLTISIWVQFYDRHRQILTPLVILIAASGGKREERSHSLRLRVRRA